MVPAAQVVQAGGIFSGRWDFFRQVFGQARYLLNPEHFINAKVLKGELLRWPRGFDRWVQSRFSVPKDKISCRHSLADFWVPFCITIGTALHRAVANKAECQAPRVILAH